MPSLQKRSYTLGVKYASARLGLRHLLEGPLGETIVRMPVQATAGAASGAAFGSLSDHPLQGALFGALSGGLGGVAVAQAPQVQKALIRALTKPK
jgi:hypothetical protein